MRQFKAWLPASMIALLLIGWLCSLASPQTPVYAQTGDTPEETETPQSPRLTKIQVQFTSYRWWLIRYSNNEIACSFLVEHEGTPNNNDIESLCDPTTYAEWINTQPCSFIDAGSWSNCPGFYLQPLDSAAGEREIEVQLAPPSIDVSVTNCNAQPGQRACTTLPNLLLTGVEPLPNEMIINIQGSIGGEPFQCNGSECNIPLRPTGMDGATVEFWADSSFGDSTDHYTAKVRLVPWGDFMNPEQASNDPQQWYVDVLSSQLTDTNLATCSETWQVFPDINGPPQWLTTTDQVEDLETDTSYYYLAGSLITHGVVDAKECPNEGLQAPNIANPCGVEAARPQLLEWQNRFDHEIIQVSQETSVPARLLKNIFARESQIWPGIFTTYKEAGLGQLTENGADTVLLWNPDFFSQFCPLVLDQKYCDLGFGNLGDEEQALLRGALVNKVNASCADCETGIDLSQANYSVRVFAEGLLANCEQVGQIINNITSLSPGQVSSYEDLWRFTLVNYNAGSGCLSNAIQSAWDQNQPLDWPNVTNYLEPACQASMGYVEDISSQLKLAPTPTPWVQTGENIPTPILPRVFETPTATPQPFLQSPTPTSTVDINMLLSQTPEATESVASTTTPFAPAPTQTLESYPAYPTATQGSYP